MFVCWRKGEGACKCMFVCAHECECMCMCVCVCVRKGERDSARARTWKQEREIQRGGGGKWGGCGARGRERLIVCSSVCERKSVCVYVCE